MEICPSATIDFCQDDDERYLHLLKEVFKSPLLQFWKKEVRELKGHVCIFTTIISRFFKFDLVKGHCLGSTPYDFFEVSDRAIQIFLGNFNQIVVMFGGIEEIGGDHRIPI